MTEEDIDSIEYFRIEILKIIYIYIFKTNQWISQQIYTIDMHAYLKSEL